MPARFEQTRRKVSILPLGDFERTGWCNWPLVGTLIAASKDPRYIVHIETVLGMRGFDSARNLAVDIARKNHSDFLVMFDNDVFSPIPPLDIVGDMIANSLDVVAVSYGVNVRDQGLRWCADQAGEVRGNYREVLKGGAGMGCAVLSRRVWTELPGPWFKWAPQQDELLSPGLGEDAWFCQRVRAAGFRIWTHSVAAQHFKTTDLSMVAAMAAMAQAAGGVR